MTTEEPLIDVSIYVWGNDLDPASVTSCLGVEASLSRRKGEKRTTRTHREVINTTNVWTLSTKKSVNLSTNIQELANKLNDRCCQINALAGVEGAYIDIYVGISADNDGGGEYKFNLSSLDIEALQRIGLPIEFTLDVVKE